MAKNINAMEAILSAKGKVSVKMTLMTILSISLPAIIEQIMITMVQYVDTAMVGALGSAATAAVGLTASTTWLIGGFLSAAAIGFSVQVAQFVGAREYESARSVVGQSVRFTAVFGVLIGAAAFAVSYPLPAWLGADAEVYPMASSYFRIIALSVPFNLCAQMFGAIIRCSGDTKTPMLLNLSINLINVVLNFLFIYPTRQMIIFGRSLTVWGAGMGVTGAALGSLLSLAIVSALYIRIIYARKSPVQLDIRKRYGFDKTVLGNVWRLGLPVALERTLTCAAQIVITGIISSVGMVAVAANHLAVTAESLSYMPAYGVATAATTMVGQAIGAQRYDLARRFSRIITYIGIVIMTLGGVLLYVLAPTLIRFFTPDAQVTELGTQVLRIVAFAEPCFAMSIVITGVLRGAGDTRAPFLISLLTMWGVRITMSLLLVGSMGLVGVWLAMAVELCVRGVLFMIRMYTDKWLRIRII